TANAYLPRGICEQPPLKQREFTNLLFAHPPLNFGMALKRAEAGARRIHEHQVKPALLRKRQLASRIKLHQIDPRLIESRRNLFHRSQPVIMEIASNDQRLFRD